MPAKKATTTKKKTPAKRAARKKKPVAKKMKKEEPVAVNICRSCHALPVGSIELVSLLLVLVFSLTAVLLTSVYALDIQADQIVALEAQVR